MMMSIDPEKGFDKPLFHDTGTQQTKQNFHKLGKGTYENPTAKIVLNGERKLSS